MKTKKLSILATSLLATIVAQPIIASDKPNVILIMCDDLGWGDVGFNGNEIIKTPNLDQMAKEGVKFNRFYAASAVSSPTRASVLTGRNPFRTGVFFANDGILRQEEITIAELLKDEGYATAHFGKWHLGTLTPNEKDGNRAGIPGNEKLYNPPKFHGYTDAFVTEVSVPTWDPAIMPVNAHSGKGWSQTKPTDKVIPYKTAYWDFDGNRVKDNLMGDDSRVIMDRVIPFIDKSTASGKPFLSVVWFHAPHAPVVAGDEYAAMYSKYNERFRNYAGCITAMDEQVGRLRAHLAKLGIDKNTMIWFCSDNGPENAPKGQGGETGGFRARKRSLYEGGVRVPAIMVWKKMVKKPFETDFPAVTSDYLPTIVSALGIDKRKCSNELDGIDLIPMLKGKDKIREEPIISCLRNQSSYSDNNIKIYRGNKGKTEYYNIVDDPYENQPLTETPELIKRKEKITKTINSFRASFEGKEYGKDSYNKMGQTWEKDSRMPKY